MIGHAIQRGKTVDRRVRVAIVQKAPAFMDREASLARAEKLIAEAAEGGTDLIVFPEVWLSGYPY